MIDMTNLDTVAGLQSNLRATFESTAGKETMLYLEQMCGWYGSIFDPKSEGMTLINDGKRQVVATIKTLLRYKPEEIVALAQKKEG